MKNGHTKQKNQTAEIFKRAKRKVRILANVTAHSGLS
jgi:hypothetical protein